MERPFRILILTAVAGFCLGGAALAQNSASQPTANGVASQFTTGADRVGSGAVQFGEGIKQGAILTWNAIVDGVTTTASHFNSSSEPAKPSQSSQ
jgi:hypothetical protein